MASTCAPTTRPRPIDLDAGEVEFLDQHAGTVGRIGFDQLMLATGGEPVRPDLPGIDMPFIHGVQSLDDAQALLALASEACRRVVIVGGGYIGLEMAEAYIERGCTATVVERAPQPLGVVDVDFGARVAEAMRSHGIDVRCGVAVEGFEAGAVHTSDGPIEADLVILGIGVKARSALAEDAGIELAAGGAIRVDDRQATTRDGVWSAGDCATSTHRVTGEPVHIALGTYANKHGRVAGVNMAGGDAARGAGARHGHHQAVRAGGRPHRVRASPRHSRPASTPSPRPSTRPPWPDTCPYASPMTVRLVAERRTGRLLGGQIVGGPGSAKRIDTVATAITAGMTVAEVVDLDLAYAPPFSSVWDPVAVAAREALKDT